MLVCICREKQGKFLVFAEQQKLCNSLTATGHALEVSLFSKETRRGQGGMALGCGREAQGKHQEEFPH